MCQHVSLPIFYGRSCSFQCVRNAASVADPVRVMVQPMAKQPPSSLAHASCCSEWLSTKDATTIVTEKTKIRVLISGGIRLVFITVWCVLCKPMTGLHAARHIIWLGQ